MNLTHGSAAHWVALHESLGWGGPVHRLTFLMKQHGLRQCNLPKVGAQSVVSAVLSRKRALWTKIVTKQRVVASEFDASVGSYFTRNGCMATLFHCVVSLGSAPGLTSRRNSMYRPGVSLPDSE